MGACALTAAMGLTGCTAIRVKLGTRVPLDKVPVTTIEASLPNGPAIAPGESSPLVVTFKDTTGKEWVTEGKGKGKILWSDLTVTPSVVTVNKKGVLSLPHDPRKSDGKTAQVEISVPSHPELHASLAIPLRYNIAYAANFDGANGSDGINGTDGTDGMSGSSGSPGSCDPDNNSAGGNGSDGTNGTDGGDGGNGGDAPPVKVMVTLRPGTQPLLQAVVSAPGRKDRHFLVDPQGGSLTIKAIGGAGGSGGRAGKGGRGGSGGSGGIGCPSGMSGNSGMDGHDGRAGSDGDPGRDGNITIIYDPSAEPYLAAIKGTPAPKYQEASVAPLW